MLHGHNGILYSNPYTTTAIHNNMGVSLQNKIQRVWKDYIGHDALLKILRTTKT